jgi:hypothetical protein
MHLSRLTGMRLELVLVAERLGTTEMNFPKPTARLQKRDGVSVSSGLSAASSGSSKVLIPRKPVKRRFGYV